MIHDYQYMREPCFVYQFNEVDNGSINSSLSNQSYSLIQTTDAVTAFATTLMCYLILHFRVKMTSSKKLRRLLVKRIKKRS